MIQLSKLIKDNVDDVVYCMREARKSGNSAVIKNYLVAAKKDIEFIIKALDYEN